jgi:hypothetical protein
MINLNIKSVYLNDLMDKTELKTINKTQTMKIALCTVGKKENLYAKEFIEYYINLGVNHIYIYMMIMKKMTKKLGILSLWNII